MAEVNYPYKNLSLKNIKGERWKDVPGLELYARISGFGRLKRLPYILEYSDDRMFHKPEKIIKPVVINIQNRFTNDSLCFLRTTITIHGQVYNFSPTRLVYHCFKKPFDLDDDTVLILTKNRDGLDIRLPNLKLGSHREKQKRIFVLKRRVPIAPGEKGRLRSIITSRAVNSKQVTQYNLQGKKIKTYPSVVSVAKETGISHSHISTRARGIEFSAGGFIWRYGKKARIDMQPMLELTEQRRKANKDAFGKKVTQFSMNGKRLAMFECIKDAAKATGVERGEISKVMRNKNNRFSAGGFYWKKGYGPTKIDLLIE